MRLVAHTLGFLNPKSHIKLRFIWLLEKDATVTKHNIIKRKWVGDPTYRFCDAVETTYHHFFLCPTARVVWGIVASCLGTTMVPNNTNQFWSWIERYLPNGKQFYTFGLAAICSRLILSAILALS